MERKTFWRVIGAGTALAVGSAVLTTIETAPSMKPSGDVVASIDTFEDGVAVRYQFTDNGTRHGSFTSPDITYGSVDATVDWCDDTTLVHNSEERRQVIIEDKSVTYHETRTPNDPACQDTRITPADFVG